ncbi:MAG: MmcQ/YjbR family DNA-binding protein [Acidobacteriota bacterium]|nr:MmcQ/YjbR family DNA-binding protein [Acidobacteriota bacterium]
MTTDDFREIALALHGVVEGAHMGHPDFRANGHIFATLHRGDRTGMVKLSPDEQRVLLKSHPAVFGPSSGAWGRQGCTNVTLAAADSATVRGAMLLAWQAAVAKPPAKRRPAASTRATRARR